MTGAPGFLADGLGDFLPGERLGGGGDGIRGVAFAAAAFTDSAVDRLGKLSTFSRKGAE